MKKIFIYISLPFLFSNSFAISDVDKPKNLQCPTAKEYITTLEFLRDNKDTRDLSEKEKMNISESVARGCNGAALRFIRIQNLLNKIDTTLKTRIDIGKELALKQDRDTNTFILIFQKSYLKEYLDLDLNTSLDLAKTFSVQFSADTEKAANDYASLVDFCVKRKSLDLPRPQCADFAKRITSKSEKYSFGVFPQFVRVFSFLSKDGDGPGLTTMDALRLSEDLISVSDVVVENFIQLYKYANTKSGLNLPRNDALELAKRVASFVPSEGRN